VRCPYCGRVRSAQSDLIDHLQFWHDLTRRNAQRATTAVALGELPPSWIRAENLMQWQHWVQDRLPLDDAPHRLSAIDRMNER